MPETINNISYQDLLSETGKLEKSIEALNESLKEKDREIEEKAGHIYDITSQNQWHEKNTRDLERELSNKRDDYREKVRDLNTQLEKKNNYDFIFKISFSLGLILLSAMYGFVMYNNPKAFEISPETIRYLARTIDALILLVIPFFLGATGAFVKILSSTIKSTKNLSVIIVSGIMGSISWIGIKSGILISLIAPQVQRNDVKLNMQPGTESEFYTMCLVAIVVGMFSSNIYVAINERVEALTNGDKSKSKNMEL